ncbi:hypothetical protein ON010_g17876 [Phytophthora cinnamomi]|nr:hypothetical protein ON010_g17876 [Phytophthora cinnamomi]
MCGERLRVFRDNLASMARRVAKENGKRTPSVGSTSFGASYTPAANRRECDDARVADEGQKLRDRVTAANERNVLRQSGENELNEKKSYAKKLLPSLRRKTRARPRKGPTAPRDDDDASVQYAEELSDTSVLVATHPQLTSVFFLRPARKDEIGVTAILKIETNTQFIMHVQVLIPAVDERGTDLADFERTDAIVSQTKTLSAITPYRAAGFSVQSRRFSRNANPSALKESVPSRKRHAASRFSAPSVAAPGPRNNAVDMFNTDTFSTYEHQVGHIPDNFSYYIFYVGGFEAPPRSPAMRLHSETPRRGQHELWTSTTLSKIQVAARGF